MVLLAAFLHAAWNSLVKIQGDRLPVMTGITLGAGAVSFAVLPFVPFPAPQVWPYLLVSLLLHTGYQLFLVAAYRVGDLSQVYPIARGIAPLLVTLVALLFLGESLSREGLFAVAMIAFGIMSLAFTRGRGSLPDPLPVLFALGTGFFIAAYTVVDGLGARLESGPHSFAVWFFALDIFPLSLVLLVRRGPAGFSVILANRWRCLLGGMMSLGAYWLVIWALTLAPMAPVAALRETSILFALLFSVFFLKERLSAARLAAVVTATGGVVLLRLRS
jgi:drug/metabolite transporter (DMT)-like permease